MKKLTKSFLITIFIAVLSAAVLTQEVNTKQGINYHVYTKKIPLYLKLLDFYDRHYNYRYLVQKLIDRKEDNRHRIIKLLSWTYQNINSQPEELAVVDDHVWHIIVRGYGTADQFSDVFCTLSTYAGMPAFCSYISSQPSGTITLSFVRAEGKVFVLDPYRGAYFENNEGALASIDDIAFGNWKAKNIVPLKRAQIEYREYLKNISADMFKYTSWRPQIQSPWKRIKFEVSKIFRHDSKKK